MRAGRGQISAHARQNTMAAARISGGAKMYFAATAALTRKPASWVTIIGPMSAAPVLAMEAMCAMAIAVDRLPRYPL